MNRSPFASATILALTLSGGVTAQATDGWSRFRGPNGSGVARDARPPVTWSDTQNLKWRTDLPGPGTSSPILVGDRLFVTAWSGFADGTGDNPANLRRHLVCLDQRTGKVLWDRTVKGESQVDPYTGYLKEHGYASHTPVSDGERVYVFFGKAGALAFDLEGNQLWQVNLGTGSNERIWGTASSPILHRDTVILNASEESHALYALDRKTGRQVWKTEAAALELAFGTPAFAPNGGQIDLVIAVPNEVWGLNPDTGKLRWFAQSGLPQNIAPSIVVGDGLAFAFGGFPRLGAIAVKLGGKGDVTPTHVAWSSNRSTYIPTPVLHEGSLYFASDTGFATCLDAKTGELVYQERLPGASSSGRGGKPFYASPVLAGGHLYAVSRRNGTFVYEAKPEFRLVAHNTFSSDDSQFNATPAVSGMRLFLRSDKHLYCVEAKPAP
jgi:outer membrane protein assembly factor BamB